MWSPQEALPAPPPPLLAERGSPRGRRDTGYFYAQNVSVLPPEYIASVYEYSRQCHALPLEVSTRRSHQRESAPGRVFTPPALPQVKRAFDSSGGGTDAEAGAAEDGERADKRGGCLAVP